MSRADTTTAGSHAVRHTASAPRTSVARRAAAVAGAVIVAVVVWALAVPVAGVRLVVSSGSGEQHIGLGLVVALSLAAGLAGWALLAVLERWARRPARAWSATALLVLLISLTGPATAAATVVAGVTLAALHLAVGAVLIPALARTAVR